MSDFMKVFFSFFGTLQYNTTSDKRLPTWLFAVFSSLLLLGLFIPVAKAERNDYQVGLRNIFFPVAGFKHPNVWLKCMLICRRYRISVSMSDLLL